jgi:peptidoglycan hydrolase-like protein with peptidoglycan-binding domain
MKRLCLLLIFALTSPALLRADDRLRDVQTELKSQGFYYGEINGQESAETTAAIRRFQIRNGLEVTGTLTDETMKSLTEPPAESTPLEAPAPKLAPPLEESDRKFLRREEARQRPAEPAPPADEPPAAPPRERVERPASDLAATFAETPYASAPREVQEDTLRRARALLRTRGFYRDAGDGESTAATEEAILSYQRSVRLRLTGRLDLETLSAMRLLPGRSPVPLKGFMPPARQTESRPVYRGVWVR